MARSRSLHLCYLDVFSQFIARLHESLEHLHLLRIMIAQPFQRTNVMAQSSLRKQSEEARQPYAIATKDGSPFGIGRLWEKREDLTSAEWIRTFAVITADAK